jgi:hypothetical protein
MDVIDPHRASVTAPHCTPLLASSHGGFQIVTHQIKLMMRLLVWPRWMHGNLRRRRGKDQPPVAGIDWFKTQHIAQKSAYFLRIWRVDNGVKSGDHLSSETSFF